MQTEAYFKRNAGINKQTDNRINEKSHIFTKTDVT